MKSIPIDAAKNIAELYGYDQVVVIARKIGKDGGEHCTTYGVDKTNCNAAANESELRAQIQRLRWGQHYVGFHQSQTDAIEQFVSACVREAIEQCAIEAGERSPEGISSHSMLSDMWDARISKLNFAPSSQSAQGEPKPPTLDDKNGWVYDPDAKLKEIRRQMEESKICPVCGNAVAEPEGENR